MNGSFGESRIMKNYLDNSKNIHEQLTKMLSHAIYEPEIIITKLNPNDLLILTGHDKDIYMATPEEAKPKMRQVLARMATEETFE